MRYLPLAVLVFCVLFGVARVDVAVVLLSCFYVFCWYVCLHAVGLVECVSLSREHEMQLNESLPYQIRAKSVQTHGTHGKSNLWPCANCASYRPMWLKTGMPSNV
jgi:hypothetical protein